MSGGGAGAARVTPERGLVVGSRYRLESVLGEGGMAVVWRATHTETDRTVALKLVRPDFVSSDLVRDMFVKEARVAARIGRNDHIVDVLDAGVDDNLKVPFIAMELLVGRGLDERIAEGPIPPVEVADLLEQLADALEQAHGAGVFHRDLKPQNLFLSHDRKGKSLLKVVDFGIAKLSESAMQSATHVGTPAYSAPEQLGESWRSIAKGRGKNIASQVSAATDVWALGLIAYEMLTGSMPGVFWGATTLAELPVKIVLEPLPAAASRADPALIPPGFDTWVMRCLQLDAAARWPSAKMAVGALLPSLVTRSSSVDLPSGAQQQQQQQPQPQPQAARQSAPDVSRQQQQQQQQQQQLAAMAPTHLPEPQQLAAVAPTHLPTPGPHPQPPARPPVPQQPASPPLTGAPVPPPAAVAAPFGPPPGPPAAPPIPGAGASGGPWRSPPMPGYPVAQPQAHPHAQAYPPAGYSMHADPRFQGWAQRWRAADFRAPGDVRTLAMWPVVYLPRAELVSREVKVPLNNVQAMVTIAEAVATGEFRKAVGEDRMLVGIVQSQRLASRVALRSKRSSGGLVDGMSRGLKALDALVAPAAGPLGDPHFEAQFEVWSSNPMEARMAVPVPLRQLLVMSRFHGIVERFPGAILIYPFNFRFDPQDLDRLLDMCTRVLSVV